MEIEITISNSERKAVRRLIKLAHSARLAEWWRKHEAYHWACVRYAVNRKMGEKIRDFSFELPPQWFRKLHIRAQNRMTWAQMFLADCYQRVRYGKKRSVCQWGTSTPTGSSNYSRKERYTD
jgi:hypothetical protein